MYVFCNTTIYYYYYFQLSRRSIKIPGELGLKTIPSSKYKLYPLLGKNDREEEVGGGGGGVLLPQSDVESGQLIVDAKVISINGNSE